MFTQLKDRLQHTLKSTRGQARLTDENITATLREVRIALLEADVSLPVVKAFINEVKMKSLGNKVAKSLNPGQTIIKIIQSELVTLMGSKNEELNLAQSPPAVVLMTGLQGAGKTTMVAKLAKRLQQRDKKKVMVVSTDIRRPAAIEQLKILAESVQVQWCPSSATQTSVEIIDTALREARNNVVDVLIIDSAGRLHVDKETMKEIRSIHTQANPIETLFVADSMTGQDAASSAQAFAQALPLTGIILTKTDGDARGGAALSITHVTGKPIKFLGTGEKTDDIEAFHPQRIAERILGMGDILTLIEEAEHKVDPKKARKITEKLYSGRGFNLEDYRDQVTQMNNMGSLESLMSKIPGMANAKIPANAISGANDEMNRSIAIINSMTPHERRFPLLINSSRKKRIASGSGTRTQDVNKTLKQFNQMQKMMKKVRGKGGMTKLVRSMQRGSLTSGGKTPFH